MPIASLGDFKSMSDGEGGIDGRTLPKTGPGGIYHEKQVGNLCAVHAMNNLLQGPLFDEYQLHKVAREFDAEERRLLGGQDVDLTGNARMDGFFNVQVIVALLERMGYKCVPLRGEEGRAALKDSAKEKGYILNRREHWFSLRKIGAEWFDLNSCMRTPQHYTDGDLQHHINEAMRAGYDVFVVRGDFPKTNLENDAKAMVEAIQGCGRTGQTYSLFAGQGTTLAGGGGGAQPMTSSDLRAARLEAMQRRANGGGAAASGGGGGLVGGGGSVGGGGTVGSSSYSGTPMPAPAPAPAPALPKSPELEQLMSMGFEEAKCRAALQKSGGNVERAMEHLL